MVVASPSPLPGGKLEALTLKPMRYVDIESLVRLFFLVDKNRDEKVDFPEFRKAFNYVPPAEAEKTFQESDRTNKGYLTLDEFCDMMAPLGYEVPEDLMLQALDVVKESIM
jgi:Ca2+-binding EF-hand superfamily protein